jgi:hypothetical protein
MKQIFFLTILFVLFLIPCLAQEANPLFVVIVNDKRGFIDKTGKIVIEPQFQGANNFVEGRAVIAVSNGQYKLGFIDEAGRIVVEAKYDNARDFSEGLAAVGVGEFLMHGGGEHKFGFIDKSGKMVIEPQFKSVGSFSEGLASVKNEKGKWGYIDKTGKLVISYKFENAMEFSDGLANVRAGKKWGYINKSGNFVINPKYTFADQFSEGLAVVKTGGRLITYEMYGDDLSEDKSPEKWQYIDKNGKVLIKLSENTENAGKFSENLASVGIIKKDGNLYNGYIDKSGKFIIEPQFGSAEEFSDGFAKVIVNGGFGFVDKTGKLMFSCKYPTECAMVQKFNNGLAWIQKGGDNAWTNFREAKYGYIDKTGKEVWQPTK